MNYGAIMYFILHDGVGNIYNSHYGYIIMKKQQAYLKEVLYKKREHSSKIFDHKV